MKQASEALTGGYMSGVRRLGINRQRVDQGKRPLARSHLPFNRRRPSYGQREIDEIADTARHNGLDREQQHELRRYLWDMRRREAEQLKEPFMLYFNAAYDAAEARIWAAHERGELRSPRTCLQVYTKICVSTPERSAESPLSRRKLATDMRLSEAEVSRMTGQLERLDLLRTDQDGRGVRYIVLPVGDHGYPLFHGDRIAMWDAASEARDQIERERQAELALPS